MHEKLEAGRRGRASPLWVRNLLIYVNKRLLLT